MLKNISLKLLSFLANSLVKKHKPFIIWITWTVGKTTSTNFVYEFLFYFFKNDVYKSEYDYNWEFWLPLTILKSKSPNKNIFLWFLLILNFLKLYFSNNYPKYLVLEYWIDRPWEMQFLANIAIPDIAIILNISPNHITQFSSFDEYISEKMYLSSVSANVIYNADDISIASRINSSKSNKLSFWIKNNSDFFAKNIFSTLENLSFDLLHNWEIFSTKFNIFWDFQVYNILPMFALSKLINIDIHSCLEALDNIHPLKWRSSILQWVNDSIIIDWSYNGGFASLSSWIDFVSSLQWDYTKILFIWDMRELWVESKKYHLEIASIINQEKIDYVVLVWDEMKKYVFDELNKKFGENKVFVYNNSRFAGDKVREIILEQNKKVVVYVKWSQNTIFLEEWIKKFLYSLQDVNKLCRQSQSWLAKKEDFFNNI